MQLQSVGLSVHIGNVMKFNSQTVHIVYIVPFAYIMFLTCTYCYIQSCTTVLMCSTMYIALHVYWILVCVCRCAYYT